MTLGASKVVVIGGSTGIGKAVATSERSAGTSRSSPSHHAWPGSPILVARMPGGLR